MGSAFDGVDGHRAGYVSADLKKSLVEAIRRLMSALSPDVLEVILPHLPSVLSPAQLEKLQTTLSTRHKVSDIVQRHFLRLKWQRWCASRLSVSLFLSSVPTSFLSGPVFLFLCSCPLCRPHS